MEARSGRLFDRCVSNSQSPGLDGPGFLIRAPLIRASNFASFAGSRSTDKRLTIAFADVECVETERGDVALVDGYALGVDAARLVQALLSDDQPFLRSVHGHYAAVILKRNGDIHGYCDRLGGRTIYWHASTEGGLVIASRWLRMPALQRGWDADGLGEMLRYRWFSGHSTLEAETSRLPIWHRVCFRRSGPISLHPSGQEACWTDEPSSSSFAQQVDATHSALTSSLQQIAGSYGNVAILLSGGVDSSLLAALAKGSFDSCLLVSPVFPGRRNPELSNAKAFAKTLGMEHLVVPFDEERVAQDFETLTRMKGGQISFHELAIHQLFAAIPGEYKLVMLGEAGDLLFGYQGLLQNYRLYRYKRLLEFIPKRVLDVVGSIPHGKLAKLARLRNQTVRDVLVQTLKIKYSEKAQRVIDSVCDPRMHDVYTHRCLIDYLCNRIEPPRLASMRRLLQHLILQSMGSNHSCENELSASVFGKHIFLPFLSRAVLDVSTSLADEHYFGRQFSKPILRNLACKYYRRELIYCRKMGFEVPFDAWLETSLAQRVAEARQERSLFDGEQLADLDCKEDYSLFWSLMSWQACDRGLSERSAASSEIAA